MKKGTYVSRAAYAKLQGEKNRLLRDIKILTDEKYFLSPEKFAVIKKWQKEWNFNRELQAGLKRIIQQDPALQAALNTIGPKSIETKKQLKKINK